VISKEKVSDKPMRGNSYEDIAKSAYKAYSASTGNKNFRGEPMPEWENLPIPIKTAWEASTRQIIDIWDGTAKAWGQFPDEQRWNGWVRPRDRKANVNSNSTSKTGD
jgi:hypothetical protein